MSGILLCILLLTATVLADWPPSPPNPPPSIGVDTSGADLPNMPVTLSSNDYTLCSSLCENTVGCRAWAFGIPGCDSYKDPVCWLKFVYPNNPTPNNCRISGIITTRPCQLETQWTRTVDPKNTLPEYPRPQMVRSDDSWVNLNGMWEFEPGTQNQQPPFGRKLSSSILVPFPVESCLSGVGKNYPYMWYRLVFDMNAKFKLPRTLVHFGSVDWQTTVYVNGRQVGSHTGGYDPFTFEITNYLNNNNTNNELLVGVFDPSNYGKQPFGKQRLDAIVNPGGDTYWPVSGIWQTVWLENVPDKYVTGFVISPSLTDVVINVTASDMSQPITLTVLHNGNVITSANGRPGTQIRIPIPSNQISLWTPNNPFLYDLQINYNNNNDMVGSYFGLRTIALGKDGNGVTRPLLNGKFQFFAGWLDQSWWPDGLYTAPTDEALAFDLKAVKDYGYNFVRLHQKVNPQRWYYYADTLGIIVQQDAVQHYGDGVSTPDQGFYFHDLTAMIQNLYNHPSIIMWTAFNEGDMVSHFNVPPVISYIKSLDPSRLVDTDSGGPANDLHIGDVNDIHTYPDPGHPKPSDTQYAQIGEFGGLGAYVDGHMWVEGACQSYENSGSVDNFASMYIKMTDSIYSNKNDISSIVYTQITDVERECDGFYNMDRTNKLSGDTLQQVVNANQRLING